MGRRAHRSSFPVFIVFAASERCGHIEANAADERIGVPVYKLPRGALPRRLAVNQGVQFGIVAVELPLKLPSYRLTAVAPTVAMQDQGLAWLVSALRRASGSLANAAQ
jgi:hypothetical protein